MRQLNLFPRRTPPPATDIMRQPCHHCGALKVSVIATLGDGCWTFCGVDHAKLHGWPWMPNREVAA